MNYKKKLRMRLTLLAFAMLCGVVSIVMGLLFSGKISGFSAGYFCGVGFGLIAACAVLTVKTLLMLKNTEKMRAARIDEEDERNTALNLTSSHIAFAAVVFMLFFGSIYFAFHNEEIVHVLAGLIFFSVTVKFISYFVLQRRM